MKNKCRECKKEKEIEKFAKDKRIKSGYATICKECDNERCRRFKENHYDKWIDTKRKWRKRTIENDPAYFRKQYQRLKDKTLKRFYEYIKTCKKQVNARNLINLHVIRGKIIKPNYCFECKDNSKKIEAHHENYDKPNEIIWLCTKCHNKADKIRRLKECQA